MMSFEGSKGESLMAEVAVAGGGSNRRIVWCAAFYFHRPRVGVKGWLYLLTTANSCFNEDMVVILDKFGLLRRFGSHQFDQKINHVNIVNENFRSLHSHFCNVLGNKHIVEEIAFEIFNDLRTIHLSCWSLILREMILLNFFFSSEGSQFHQY